VHKEAADVFRQLYAGDEEHPSRMGTYLNALLFYKSVTGRSPLQAPKLQVTDDESRLHADMWDSPEEWSSSDSWQRRAWPRWPLPEVDDVVDGRLRMWAQNVMLRHNTAPQMRDSHEMSKPSHINLAVQRNADGPCIALPKAKPIGSARAEKQPPATSHPKQLELRFQAPKVDRLFSHQECMLFPQTLHVGPCLLTSAIGTKCRAARW
jgi:hypothetical protein